MTYSQQIKNEFCQCKLHCKRCAGALLYGMLLFGKGGEGRTVSFTTENKEAAYLFAHTVIDLTGAIVTVAEPDLRVKNKRPQYSVTVDDENYADTIRRLFWKNGKEDHDWIQPEMVGRECCAMAFLRGAYLACGTMIDPAKEYHLEFAVASESLCDDLIGLLDEYDLDFRKSVRMKKLIVYTKESNQIEDFLARTGAVRSSMDLMNLKIEKELRNKVNRVTNCETANIGKTVNASMEQIRKIRLIQEKQGLEQLPLQLKEAARLRLENPDASLRELCEMTGGKISRSGWNHRLQKLCELAEKLEE